MTDAHFTQAAIYALASGDGSARLTQAAIYALATEPAAETRVTQANVYALAALEDSGQIHLTQANVYALVRRRAENPILRAWPFTLDNHDYYVLRLGDSETLVYDTYSEQWVDWGTLNLPYWRANIGANWIGGEALAYAYGSNVLVGDDTFGLLWFLNPAQPYDESPLEDAEEYEYFDRVTQGQIPLRGREVLPCNAVWLTSNNTAPAYDGAGVTLSYSDDAGLTYTVADTITVAAGDGARVLEWRSLGQIASPGRLFKIEDDGALVRIDAMEMNDPN
jgi:hypothetical protein